MQTNTPAVVEETTRLFFFKCGNKTIFTVFIFLFIVNIIAVCGSLLVPSATSVKKVIVTKDDMLGNNTLNTTNEYNHYEDYYSIPSLVLEPFRYTNEEFRLFFAVETPTKTNMTITVELLEYDEELETYCVISKSLEKEYIFNKCNSKIDGYDDSKFLASKMSLPEKKYLINFELIELTEAIKSIQFKLTYRNTIRSLVETYLRHILALISCIITIIYMWVLRNSILVDWHQSQKVTLIMLCINVICVDPTFGIEYIFPIGYVSTYADIIYSVYISFFLFYNYRLFDYVQSKIKIKRTIIQAFICVCIGIILAASRLTKNLSKGYDNTTMFIASFNILEVAATLTISAIAIYLIVFFIFLTISLFRTFIVSLFIGTLTINSSVIYVSAFLLLSTHGQVLCDLETNEQSVELQEYKQMKRSSESDVERNELYEESIQIDQQIEL
ncbi:Wntless-like transmembrane domain-containing protein [Entamoeba marina]